MIKIEKVNIYQISLPFTGHFPHYQSDGKCAKNIVCELIADQGTICGYGEGAPRDFVTGETQESASEDITRFVYDSPFPVRLDHVSQIWDFIDAIDDVKNHQSAICALEMALLDAIGKKQNRYLTAYFSKDFFTDAVCYGAIIPLLDKVSTRRLCSQIHANGINRIKLKMGKTFSQNKVNLEIIHDTFQNGYNLKVDVNCAWDERMALENLPLIKDFGIRVVEQPMERGQPHSAKLTEKFSSIGVLLMADESACSLDDVSRIAVEKDYTMINIRLSKCGGFRNSLKMIEVLRKENIPFQIGCHLGESGVLSAAGRILSLLSKDAVYHDGSYDSFLLKENVTQNHVMFGKGGIAGPLEGPGLGVEISKPQLDRLSEKVTSIALP
jgi:L-alanine-DL-glutamate epimerase-like enolase superfamily enzyme